MAAAAVLFPGVVLTADQNSDFWATWSDGKAELDGYTLTQPRYGHPREGKAVMIFVTEEHSPNEHVKIEGDTSQVSPKDKYPVLKLNFARNFETGIYPYHILCSVFCRVDDQLQPSKISVSVQEWCGHVYHQVIVDRRRAVETLHSYFGGEADQTTIHKHTEGIVWEDALPVLVRELQGPWLRAGETRQFRSAPSLVTLRLLHQPLVWQTISVTKEERTLRMGSVLGSIAVRRWVIVSPLQGTLTYAVEAAWPHRIVQWSSTEGESGVLTGSKRLPYWKLHNPGDEKYLKDLGWLAP